ncbi:MAG: hypothetical protein ACRC1J_01005 [Sandaracinobacteroides sp.]
MHHDRDAGAPGPLAKHSLLGSKRHFLDFFTVCSVTGIGFQQAVMHCHDAARTYGRQVTPIFIIAVCAAGIFGCHLQSPLHGLPAISRAGGSWGTGWLAALFSQSAM